MNWRNATKWAIVGGVVIAAGCVGARWWIAKGEPVSEAAKMNTAAATRGPLRQIVQCTGIVYSNLDVDIKCRASGQVITLPYDISDPVKKGDLLLALDPVDQQRAVDQAGATVAAAQARFDQAKATLAVAVQSVQADKLKAEAAGHVAERQVTDSSAKAKRENELLDKKFSSPELLETAQTAAVQAAQNLKTAQAQMEAVKAEELDLENKRQDINLFTAQLNQAKIALDLAKLQLSYCNIFSPIDGVISTRPVQIGAIISSGISNIGGGTTVMTLSDLSHIYCYGSVDESQIGYVQLDQAAEITADSFPRKLFKGKVVRIATAGVSVQNVVTFQVRIEITSENKTLLKPQMTTNVTIVTADKPDVLQIPANAVTRRKEGDFVAMKNPDGTAGQLQPITIGISDGMQTEVVSGLNEGDEVVVQNPEDETRWRSGGQNQSSARQQMMMMRTLGGGGRGGGGGRR